MIEPNTIQNVDCLVGMKDIPDGSINCIVTSPPYWGLRDYGLEPLIWDAKDGCGHQWQTEVTHRPNSSGGKASESNTYAKKLATKGVDNYSEFTEYDNRTTKSDFCSLCGAWRGSLGLEPTFQLYLDHLMQIMSECKRVLANDGTMWINIGDSYGGSQSGGIEDNKAAKHGTGATSLGKHRPCKNILPKSLIGIPERLAIRMTDELNLIRRNTIIWWKRNCMPSSAKDRFTVDFEPVYFFTKSGRYWFEQQKEPALGYDGRKDIEYKGGKKDMAGGAHTRWHFKNLQEKGQTTHTMHENRLKGIEYKSPIRNMRTVWDIPTKPFAAAHFAVFPETLVTPMILAGCPEGGIVCDPFMGSGTVAKVALHLNRLFIGFEANPEYIDIAQKRIAAEMAQMRLEL